ncbi:uncharacterized protein L969DRAFT_47766, partial [Mixia osmundae IAM 14324]|uniref:uncharacterized protein n=1 Tax=Mixia osmundae (strain CBS 9802 / IAM 14324 / JCM 22182 / KY 12970) TaxID=764103 RepID=UPI0004A54C31
ARWLQFGESAKEKKYLEDWSALQTQGLNRSVSRYSHQVDQLETQAKMKYLAAYLLLNAGGNTSPSKGDITSLLETVGIEVESGRLDSLMSELEGKDINELIASGSSKLASVPSGGGGGAAAAPAAGGAAAGGAAAEEKAEEKKEEEKEESDDDMASHSPSSLHTVSLTKLCHYRASVCSTRFPLSSLCMLVRATTLLFAGRPRPFSRSLSTASASSTSTINADEVAHFAKLSAKWWDEQGEFALLHRMNPVRLDFMRQWISRSEVLPARRWLTGRRVLDVGCGGGLLSESLTRLGARTTGIDATAANILMASLHAAQDPALHSATQSKEPSLTYRHAAAEDLVDEGAIFDIVCAMEVIEHVDDPRGFLTSLAHLVKPGGHLLMSTISRTLLARLLTITIAESPVLGFVSPGTHHYDKYIKPDELNAFIAEDLKWQRNQSSAWTETRGVIYNPLRGSWVLMSPDSQASQLANYFYAARKPA